MRIAITGGAGFLGSHFMRASVSAGLAVHGRVDAVAHLASPAAPPDYLRHPLETPTVGVVESQSRE